MRTSRKKLLRLDEKTCYYDDFDGSEEDRIIAQTIVASPVISNPRKRFLSANTAVVSYARLIVEGVIVTTVLSASIHVMSMTGNQETG